MSAVKSLTRYRPVPKFQGAAAPFVPDPIGPWVRVADVERLIEQLERLERLRSLIEGERSRQATAALVARTHSDRHALERAEKHDFCAYVLATLIAAAAQDGLRPDDGPQHPGMKVQP